MTNRILLLIFLLFFVFTGVLFSAKKPSDIRILFNYYDQDGNNSPVTGGTGTEDLSVIAPQLIVNYNINDNHSVSIKGGIDIITSASTDKIDTINSSASLKDQRTYGNIWYTRNELPKNQSLGIMLGASSEYDYLSLQTGFKWIKESADKNKNFTLLATAFIDFWELYFPEELRANTNLTSEKLRQTYTLSVTYGQTINKRTHANMVIDFVYQNGLLSTPFHRVVFNDQSVGIEKLPSDRFKIPVGFNLNSFLNSFLILRLSYRFYWDSFNIIGNTTSLELPFKISRVTLSPSYRFHIQTAADDFKKSGKHNLTDQFFTSDHDLSSFYSQQWGLTLRYSPILKNMFSTFRFNSYEIRYVYYLRENGLYFHNLSTAFNFAF